EACNYPHGKCNGPDLCECQEGYTGTECEIYSCYSKFGTDACSYPNGTCEEPNKCECKQGYLGNECEQISCFGKVVTEACNYPNGVCIAPDTCRCHGWLGDECTIKNEIYTFGYFGGSNPVVTDMAGYLSGVNISRVITR